MSRRGWVLARQASTVLAVAGGFRLAASLVLLAMGRPWEWDSGWALVGVAAFTVAMVVLALHANRRRKALLLEEMPPPPGPAPP